MPKKKTAPAPQIEGIQWHEELLPLSRLKRYAKNPRNSSKQDIERLKALIQRHGYHDPIICNTDLTMLGGHARHRALTELGHTEARVLLPSRPLTPEEFEEINVAHNGSFGTFDIPMLTEAFEIAELVELGIPADLLPEPEVDASTSPADDTAATASLRDRFLLPPFSVLDARQGYWMERKRQWMALGIRSELGRDAQLIHNGGGMASKSRYEKGSATKGVLLKSASGRVPDYYKQKEAAEKKVGRKLSNEEFEAEHLQQGDGSNITDTGTSVFDPVLTEASYLWFCPPGGTILDPFAGGSVRGVVAAATGRQYVGVELRGEQVDANRVQWDEIGPRLSNAEDAPAPVWHQGDSSRLLTICKGLEADMVMGCPPYADLEVYSDHPDDISNMPYEQFLSLYRSIIAQACSLLRPNRFAVWVIGEVREKKGGGAYRGFVPDTIRAFEDAGMRFYNEAILVTPTGSLAMRAGRQFSTGRKLAKNHQNVLVFVKGDPRAAADACGVVELPELEDAPDES